MLVCVDVTTRGKYYPDTTLSTERDPPLYLHITATTYPALEKASRMVQELIDRDLGSLVDERRYHSQSPRNKTSLLCCFYSFLLHFLSFIFLPFLAFIGVCFVLAFMCSFSLV